MLHRLRWIETATQAAATSHTTGQTNVEYALILFLIAGVVAIAYTIVGQQVTHVIQDVNGAFSGRL